MDHDIIEEEFQELVKALSAGTMNRFRANNYLDEGQYEDDYSHRDIDDAQSVFMRRARRHLKENYAGEYGVHCDWCVHVCSKEMIEKLELDRGYIV